MKSVAGSVEIGAAGEADKIDQIVAVAQRDRHVLDAVVGAVRSGDPRKVFQPGPLHRQRAFPQAAFGRQQHELGAGEAADLVQHLPGQRKGRLAQRLDDAAQVFASARCEPRRRSNRR